MHSRRILLALLLSYTSGFANAFFFRALCNVPFVRKLFDFCDDDMISIGRLGGTATSPYATVTFAEGTFNETTTVSFLKASDAETEASIEFDAAIFGASAFLSYQVLIKLSSVPLTETVQATFVVPAEFFDSVSEGSAIETIVSTQQGSLDELLYRSFELVDECLYDSSRQEVVCELPANIFIETEGDFIAIVTLAVTPGLRSRRRQRKLLRSEDQTVPIDVEFVARQIQTTKCEAASIKCPVSGGCEVKSPFNKERFHPTVKETRAHLAVDYKAKEGTPILAAADGRIEQASNSKSLGGTVVLRHGDGSTGTKAPGTRYGHLSMLNVKEGDMVKAGDKLGLSGGTPGTPNAGKDTTGPHLHFEYAPSGALFKNKNRIDPHPCIDELVSGSIIVGDNGLRADDAFTLSLDGFVIGTTAIGATNQLAVNNLKAGTYTLTLTVVIAPDDLGTWFIQLNDGLTFSDATTFKSQVDVLGQIVNFTIIVPPA